MAATLLTTVESVKDYLGLKDTNIDRDAVLASLIEQCSAQIENACQRVLGENTHSSLFDGNGDSRMQLPQYPVKSVSLVAINGQTVAAASDVLAAGYRFFDVGELHLNLGSRFTRGRRNVQVTYVAGYASDEVPGDLTLATNRAVANMYKSKDWAGYLSKSLAGETITFRDELDRPAVKAILSNYKRVVPS